jgi:hypothetical protein
MSITQKQINEVFTPSAPINDEEHFVGRTKEKEMIQNEIISPGAHIAIFGERGVGKTSLMKITSKKFKDLGFERVIEYRCASNDTFDMIFGNFLDKTNQLSIEQVKKIKESRNLDASVSITFAKGGVKSTYEIQKEKRRIIEYNMSLDELANKYCQNKFIFIIDEFDRVECAQTKQLLSETIKTLSDYLSNTKLIITGVSDTFFELIGDHESNIRSLIPIKVPLMKDWEIKRIINNGCRRLKITFSDDLTEFIVKLSNGLPYFAHMLSNSLAAIFVNNNTKSQLESKDLFEILESVLQRLGDYPQTYYDNAVTKCPENIIDKNTDIDSVPPACVRELCLMAFALSDRGKAISKYYNFLVENDHRVVPQHHKNLTNKDVFLILQDTCKLSKILKITNNKVQFRNSYFRGYVWLRAARLFGEKTIVNIGLDRNGTLFNPTIGST